jgi:hypothetical protein
MTFTNRTLSQMRLKILITPNNSILKSLKLSVLKSLWMKSMVVMKMKIGKSFSKM